MNYTDVLHFWFKELTPEQHFEKDAKLDDAIRERFSSTHSAAARGELFRWRGSTQGRLAEIIVLDQFSRNLYRRDPRAFACDGMALVLAQEAIQAGADKDFSPAQKVFFYMPYMHSESLAIHGEALELFAQPGLEDNLKFERKHLAILNRFGRYPHRNAALDRQSTDEELEFLKQPGSGF